MRLAGWLLAAAVAACSGPPERGSGASGGPAETFLLAGGGEISGHVVMETEASLFVDVGATIVDLPRAAVLARAPREAEEEEDGASPETFSDALFSRARLPQTSVRDLVERFGEAVVAVKTPSGQGSGFVIHEEGYVVTNAHVVQGERRITLTLFRRTEREFEKLVYEECRLVATNPFWDLALLKIEPKEERKGPPFTKVHLAEAGGVRVGESVFAIGNPLGLERTVSEGIVSSTNRERFGMVFVQTTAQVNPGNSGGPLFNLRGEVVGVIAWKYFFSEGLNFAIPVGYLEDFLRNREAFAFDPDNPNTGVLYLPPPATGRGDAGALSGPPPAGPGYRGASQS